MRRVRPYSVSFLRATPLLFVCSTLLIGCSAFKQPSDAELKQKVDWTYQADGIVIEINASEDLNEYLGQAHALTLGVVQVATPSKINAYLSKPASIAQLLETEKIGSTQTNFNRLSITPSEQREVSLARVEKAQYVAFVAGYYKLVPENVAQVVAIPVKIEEQGHIPFFKTKVAVPEVLHVKIDFTNDKMGKVTIVDADAKKQKSKSSSKTSSSSTTSSSGSSSTGSSSTSSSSTGTSSSGASSGGAGSSTAGSTSSGKGSSAS